MKKLALVGAILIAAPLSAQANLLFTVGAKASVWDAEPTGQIDDNVSVEKGGLNLKSENGTQITVFFEHPVPFIPNVKLKSTDLDIKGSGVLNANINFADRKSTRLNSSHVRISYAVFCLKKKIHPNSLLLLINTYSASPSRTLHSTTQYSCYFSQCLHTRLSVAPFIPF